MAIETLQSGWVTYKRYHCLEGFIDKWVGDMNDHPDNKSKHNLSLNTTSTCYRLNGEGDWVDQFYFERSIQVYLYTHSDSFTAQEIWEESKIK